MKNYKYELKKQVERILDKYLKSDKFSMSIIEFVWVKMDTKLAQSIIGLENYKKQNPGSIKNSDMSLCLYHDILGILKEEKMFIPRASSYAKYY
tara:strand:- start:556 stop:837 length:282 start_codon:yes stop_codon:yes gene_type:complete